MLSICNKITWCMLGMVLCVGVLCARAELPNQWPAPWGRPFGEAGAKAGCDPFKVQIPNRKEEYAWSETQYDPFPQTTTTYLPNASKSYPIGWGQNCNVPKTAPPVPVLSTGTDHQALCAGQAAVTVGVQSSWGWDHSPFVTVKWQGKTPTTELLSFGLSAGGYGASLGYKVNERQVSVGVKATGARPNALEGRGVDPCLKQRFVGIEEHCSVTVWPVIVRYSARWHAPFQKPDPKRDAAMAILSAAGPKVMADDVANCWWYGQETKCPCSEE